MDQALLQELLAGIGRKLMDEDEGQAKAYLVDDADHCLPVAVFPHQPPAGLPPDHVRVTSCYTRRSWAIPAADLKDFMLKRGGAYISLVPDSEIPA